jgi:HEPN domain-containing protein
MTSIPEKWMERAHYDLDTAQAMLDSGRLIYVLFCSQQAVEKALKSVIAKRTEESPPRIHNLGLLLERSSLNASSEQTDFLLDLSSYYIRSRYPEEAASFDQLVNHDMAQQVLDSTRSILQWIASAI